MIDNAVAGHVHHRAAVVQRAELVEGGERGARVRGLVAERPIQLGGMPDGLVDGQEQIARVDDQVVVPGQHRWCGDLFGEQFRHLGGLRVEVPAGPGQILPAAPGRRSGAAHGGESMITDTDGGELGLDPYPLLGGRGAGEVGEELVLLDVGQHRVGVGDAGCGQQHLVQFQQPSGLGRFVHVERIDLVRGHPARVRVHLLVGQFDRHRRQRTGHLGGGDRALGQSGRGIGGQRDVGRETPHPVVHHPDGQAENLAVRRRLQTMITEAAVRLAQPLHPELGVPAAQFGGAGQGRIGQRRKGQGREVGVEVGHDAHPNRPTPHSAGRPPKMAGRAAP